MTAIDILYICVGFVAPWRTVWLCTINNFFFFFWSTPKNQFSPLEVWHITPEEIHALDVKAALYWVLWDILMRRPVFWLFPAGGQVQADLYFRKDNRNRRELWLSLCPQLCTISCLGKLTEISPPMLILQGLEQQQKEKQGVSCFFTALDFILLLRTLYNWILRGCGPTQIWMLSSW